MQRRTTVLTPDTASRLSRAFLFQKWIVAADLWVILMGRDSVNLHLFWRCLWPPKYESEKDWYHLWGQNLLVKPLPLARVEILCIVYMDFSMG